MSEMPVFVIKAKDALAPEAVGAYRDLCLKYGLDSQAAEVRKALSEISAWQLANEDRVKLPDHEHVPTPTSDPATGSRVVTPRADFPTARGS